MALVALQETVAVPEPVTLFGEIVPQLNPWDVASVRTTVPANPFCPVMVIVVLVDWPTLTPAGEVAASAKSAPAEGSEYWATALPSLYATPLFPE